MTNEHEHEHDRDDTTFQHPFTWKEFPLSCIAVEDRASKNIENELEKKLDWSERWEDRFITAEVDGRHTSPLLTE